MFLVSSQNKYVPVKVSNTFAKTGNLHIVIIASWSYIGKLQTHYTGKDIHYVANALWLCMEMLHINLAVKEQKVQVTSAGFI